jgi:thiamine-monophosphate kinase
MPATEFELIQRYFQDATRSRPDVLLGIGDDCALLQVPDGQTLAVSIDTLVAGQHFADDHEANALGHKALAVNLSDLAAMGAEPAWVTLALTLPTPDETWLRSFMQGFAELAAAFGLQLVGGDTTRGPLSITIQVQGLLPAGMALRRDSAEPGQKLFVSGTLGGAALALRQRRSGAVDPGLALHLDRPQPRVALGRLLRDYAGAAIDISDGLLADLSHICRASAVGARIALDRLPLEPEVKRLAEQGDWQLPLAGGDDYELLFTVPPDRVDALRSACEDAGEPVSEIGEVTGSGQLHVVLPNGQLMQDLPHGFDHFRA